MVIAIAQWPVHYVERTLLSDFEVYSRSLYTVMQIISETLRDNYHRHRANQSFALAKLLPSSLIRMTALPHVLRFSKARRPSVMRSRGYTSEYVTGFTRPDSKRLYSNASQNRPSANSVFVLTQEGHSRPQGYAEAHELDM